MVSIGVTTALEAKWEPLGTDAGTTRRSLLGRIKAVGAGIIRGQARKL